MASLLSARDCRLNRCLRASHGFGSGAATVLLTSPQPQAFLRVRCGVWNPADRSTNGFWHRLPARFECLFAGSCAASTTAPNEPAFGVLAAKRQRTRSGAGHSLKCAASSHEAATGIFAALDAIEHLPLRRMDASLDRDRGPAVILP